MTAETDGMRLLLGIDFGTGGCKVTVIDADGAFVGDAAVEYPTYHEHPGWSEQEPADWWASLCRALERLSAKGVDLKSVAACALDGSTHNAVLLDAGYSPVRRTIMWTDQRATAECDALKAGWGEKIFSTCYQMPAPTWTLPQMMWLKANEPEALERTEHVLFVKDYVRYLLTGEAATASIEAQGTPVVCGTSDSAVEDYGADAVEPGDLIIKLATAGNVNSMTATAHPHPKTLTYSHVVPGMWYSVSATNAAALCMRWLRDAFYRDAAEDNLYALIDREVAPAPADAAKYDHLFTCYRRLHDALAPVYSQRKET